MGNKQFKEMRKAIRRWMAAEFNASRGDYIDSSGEFNCTKFAEACADALNHPEWLDDETHEVWGAAFDFSMLHDDMESEAQAAMGSMR